MKILLVHNYYGDRGGEDVYFDSLVRLLKKNGCQVVVFTKKSFQTIPKVVAIKSLFGFDYKVKKELSDLIDKERPDVAHFHNLYPLIGPAAYSICNKYNIPIVQTIHNYRLLWPRGIFLNPGRSMGYSVLFFLSILLNLKKKIYNLVDCFIFPSQFTSNYYLKRAHFKIKRYFIIPHFADTKSLKPVKKSDYFMFAGRFSKEKGVVPLLKIFSELPKINLLVIGDGPQQPIVNKYKKYINITILPWMNKNKVYQYIKKARALISPALSFEVMPLTVIESLVLSTQVVVPNRGAFVELIKNNQDGKLFNFGDFNDLKNVIIKLNRSKSKNTHTNYHKYYSPENHYSSLMKVYKKFT